MAAALQQGLEVALDLRLTAEHIIQLHNFLGLTRFDFDPTAAARCSSLGFWLLDLLLLVAHAAAPAGCVARPVEKVHLPGCHGDSEQEAH
jgi:hypothetical protein